MILDISAAAIFAALSRTACEPASRAPTRSVNYGVRPLGSLIGGFLGSQLGLGRRSGSRASARYPASSGSCRRRFRGCVSCPSPKTRSPRRRSRSPRASPAWLIFGTAPALIARSKKPFAPETGVPAIRCRNWHALNLVTTTISPRTQGLDPLRKSPALSSLLFSVPQRREHRLHRNDQDRRAQRGSRERATRQPRRISGSGVRR